MAMYTILIVDDEHLIRWSLSKELQRAGYQVKVASEGKSALDMIVKNQPNIILLDIKLPDIDGLEILQRVRSEYPEIVVIMITAHSIVELAVKALKAGAYDYICKPFNFEELLITIQKVCEMLTLKRGMSVICGDRTKKFSFDNIIGKSSKMQELFAILPKIIEATDTTVLLQGESGTGKDLIAKTIHYTGARKQSLFVEINCSAIPEDLLESELFGFEKGAFTDAKLRKNGLLEMADGGTLYLDEIGDMPYAMQAKLLKFIENKSFRRLGGVDDISVDVRIIAATNHDLEQAIAEKRFRQDLYYRLNVLRLTLPTLRERHEDILLLADYFFKTLGIKMRKKENELSSEVQKIFQNYSWPGNVRELQNVIERSLILMEGYKLLPIHLPSELLRGSLPTSETHLVSNLSEKKFALEEHLNNIERELIYKALTRFQNNQVHTADFLGLSRDALRYRMKKLNIP